MNQQRWMLILPNPRRAFVTYRLRTQQSPPSSKPGGKKMQNSKTPRNPIAVARSGQKELSYTTNTRGQSRAVSHLGWVPSLSPPSLTRGWTSPLPPPPSPSPTRRAAGALFRWLHWCMRLAAMLRWYRGRERTRCSLGTRWGGLVFSGCAGNCGFIAAAVGRDDGLSDLLLFSAFGSVGGLRFQGLALFGGGLGEKESPGLVPGHLLKYFPRAILVCG